MAITRLYPDQYLPETVCILAKTGFIQGDHDYFLADSSTAYLSYINSVKIDQNSDFSYIGSSRLIRYNGNAEDIVASGCDYVAWRNTNFSDKWWFGYVENVIYVNPNMTHIQISVDVIATFIYDIDLGSQFCKRMITPTDGIAEWLDDENLPCPEYVYHNWNHPVITGVAGGRLDDFAVAVAGFGLDIPVASFDGLPYSGNIDIFSNPGDLYTTLMDYNNNEEASVYSVYAIPKFAVGGDGKLFSQSLTWGDVTVSKIVYGGAFPAITPADQSAWTANNYKMYTYPFNCLYVTNNNGNSAYFKYEYFDDQQPKFLCACNHVFPITPRIYPVNYEGSESNRRGINDNYAFDLGDMPQIGYMGNGYDAWISSHGTAMRMEMVGAILQTALSYYAAGQGGEGVAAVTNTVTSTALSQIARHQMAQHTPPRSLSNNVAHNSFMTIGDTGTYGPTFAQATIPQHVAKQYDDYLSIYGYAVNRVMPINLFGDRRPLFNYYETQNAHISANIPMIYARQIEQLFNEGIRFWYNPAKIGDFSDANLKENSLH